MEILDSQSNLSVTGTTQIISDNQREIISLVNYVILGEIVSLFGSIANVINMVVFYRQGLDTTINISFFSLAVSDLIGLILQQLYNFYMNPLIVNLDLPIVYNEFQYITIALNREVFAQTTCLITAFITAERCFCVVFPLQIKRMITPKVTTTVIAVIFMYNILSPFPIFVTTYPTWKMYPDSNSTRLGFAVTNDHTIAEAVVYLSHGLFTLLGFMSVLVFTLILIYKLEEKRAWRQTANVDQEKSKSISKRDRSTMSMVVLIAGILVMCYTPAVLLSLATFLEPEFSFGPTKYFNLCYSLWTFAILFESINSSVNIFLYFRMSSKYRHTFKELFHTPASRTHMKTQVTT